jgi:EmrB/QacA subfamily drug resistance transporter
MTNQTLGERGTLMSPGRIRLAAIGCMATLLLALLDINIVGSVSWKMVDDLDPAHGVALLPWLTAAYALADCAVVPLYGRLADVHGAKPGYLWALGIFLTGSCLCGLARSMPELIAFRTLQGLGAGGLMSVTMVIMGLLFRDPAGEPLDSKENTTTTGLGGIMVGLGVALGPLLGGVVSDTLNWRWAFYLNLPLGFAALAIALTVLRLPADRRPGKVDFAGAALIAGGASALLLVLQWGGRQYAWGSPVICGLGVAGVVLTVAFVRRTMTAAEPLISLRLLRSRMFRTMMPIGLFAGIGLSGSLFYLSGYLQIGRGLTPAQSAVLSLPIAAGMVAAVPLGRFVSAWFGKAKYLLTFAGVLQALALTVFGTLTDSSPYAWIALGGFVIGLGIGQSLGLGLQFVQNAVGVEDLGVATTSQRFVQQLGTSIGFAVFGTLLTRLLAVNLTGAAGGASRGGELDIATLALLPPGPRHAAVDAFISSVDVVFLVAAAVALVPALLALRIPERRRVGAVSAR